MEERARVATGHLLGVGVAALADGQQICGRIQVGRSAADIRQKRHVDHFLRAAILDDRTGRRTAALDAL